MEEFQTSDGPVYLKLSAIEAVSEAQKNADGNQRSYVTLSSGKSVTVIGTPEAIVRRIQINASSVMRP